MRDLLATRRWLHRYLMKADERDTGRRKPLPEGYRVSEYAEPLLCARLKTVSRVATGDAMIDGMAEEVDALTVLVYQAEVTALRALYKAVRAFKRIGTGDSHDLFLAMDGVLAGFPHLPAMPSTVIPPDCPHCGRSAQVESEGP